MNFSRTDFQLLRRTAERYFYNIPNNTDLIHRLQEPTLTGRDLKTKERLGFYLYALECITEVKETDEIIEMMNDGTFLTQCINTTNDDYGVDAVYIDEENHKINLFNFQYAENFNTNNVTLPYSHINNSSRFLSLLDQDIEHLDKEKRTYLFLKNIKELIHTGNVPYEITLYYVSNAGYTESAQQNIDLASLAREYSIRIESCCLDYFLPFIKPRPESMSCKITLENNSILTFEESRYSSEKSYILDITMGELLRITSVDEELRNKSDLDDFSCLLDSHLNEAVLYDNIRGYLDEKGKYNKSILKTISEDPKHFFYFNNGITIVSDSITTQDLRRERTVIDINGIQVVNGGQTLKSLDKFMEKYRIEDLDEEDKEIVLSTLESVHILVKVFNTGNNDNLKFSISEYTNSQNSISAVDLKSNDSIQIAIDNYLRSHNIFYVRKAGIPSLDIHLTERISMDFMGQLLYSKNGNPQSASNNKQAIFDSNKNIYASIFKNPSFDIEDTLFLYNNVKEIKETYKETTYKVYNQKVFYIVYMLNFLHNTRNISQNIQLLEETLSNFQTEVSESRTLSYIKFKEALDLAINEE